MLPRAVQNVVSVFDDRWTRVKDSSYAKGFGTPDASLSTYHYVDKSGTPLFVFWTHGRDWRQVSGKPRDSLLGEGKWALAYHRPGDSFETRPAFFRYTGGKPLTDPVWVDLFTGHVYELPRSRQFVAHGTVRFIDIPVYDSPCVLTEKSALPLMAR